MSDVQPPKSQVELDPEDLDNPQAIADKVTLGALDADLDKP